MDFGFRFGLHVDSVSESLLDCVRLPSWLPCEITVWITCGFRVCLCLEIPGRIPTVVLGLGPIGPPCVYGSLLFADVYKISRRILKIKLE